MADAPQTGLGSAARRRRDPGRCTTEERLQCAAGSEVPTPRYVAGTPRSVGGSADVAGPRRSPPPPHPSLAGSCRGRLVAPRSAAPVHRARFVLLAERPPRELPGGQGQMGELGLTRETRSERHELVARPGCLDLPGATG